MQLVRRFIRRLTANCLCVAMSPFSRYGVACPFGDEKNCMQSAVHVVSHQSSYRLKYGFLPWEQLCDEMPGLFRWSSSAFSRTQSARSSTSSTVWMQFIKRAAQPLGSTELLDGINVVVFNHSSCNCFPNCFVTISLVRHIEKWPHT